MHTLRKPTAQDLVLACGLALLVMAQQWLGEVQTGEESLRLDAMHAQLDVAQP